MRALIALTVLAVGLLVVPGAFADRSYTDPAGDSGAAPDITAVTVSHDALGLTLEVTTNQPTLTDDNLVWGFFDTDRNDATGFPSFGAELVFLTGGDGGALFRVMGDRIEVDFDSSFTASYANGTLTARFDRSELGTAVQTFRFALVSELDDPEMDTIAEDQAPDGAPFYEYSFAPLAVALGNVSSTPRRPVAGKALTVSSKVSRSDAAPVTAASARCVMRVGSRALRSTGRVVGGTARCSTRVPRDAGGKVLRGSLTVLVAGAPPARRAFAFRVARPSR